MNANERRLPKPATTKRKCLKCGRSFASTGLGNRICIACGKRNRDFNQAARCESLGASMASEEGIRQYVKTESPEASIG